MKLPSFLRLIDSIPMRRAQATNTVTLAAMNQGCGDCGVVNQFNPALHEQCYDAGAPCYVVANEGREFCVSQQDISNQMDEIVRNFPNDPQMQLAAMVQLARDFKILPKHCVRLLDLRVRADVPISSMISVY